MSLQKIGRTTFTLTRYKSCNFFVVRVFPWNSVIFATSLCFTMSNVFLCEGECWTHRDPSPSTPPILQQSVLLKRLSCVAYVLLLLLGWSKCHPGDFFGEEQGPLPLCSSQWRLLRLRDWRGKKTRPPHSNHSAVSSHSPSILWPPPWSPGVRGLKHS